MPFPPLKHADEDGLLAVGGDYSPEMLLAAYTRGIFPWPVDGFPEPLWFAPPQRAVLEFSRFHVSHSLKPLLKRKVWQVRVDTCFERVMRECAAPRAYADGTWIRPEMVAGYSALNARGLAHSVEVFEGEELVGGLYGVAIGSYFCGESMFFRRSGASKLAVVRLVELLRERGAMWLDCQQLTPLFGSFGAREVPREEFTPMLREAQRRPLIWPATLE
jgi:leucyl/phenylalanyl-tRNA--protein transferase